MVCEIEYANINKPIKATAMVEANPYVNNKRINDIIIIPKNINKPIPKLNKHFLEIILLALSWNCGDSQNNNIITTNANKIVDIELYNIDSPILEVF